MNAKLKVYRAGFFCLVMIGSLSADSIDCVTQKSILMEKLDSIDMEKQIRKRKGLSLEDLERKSLLLKDSIAALKKDFHREKGVHPSASKISSTQLPQWQRNRLFPRNTFDWLVLIFAAIAFIAGTILCIGLFTMLWKTVILKRKPPLKTFREDLSLRAVPPPRENKTRASEMNQRRIESLRERISEESKNSAPPPQAPLSETPPKVPAQVPVIKVDKNEDSNPAKLDKALHAGIIDAISINNSATVTHESNPFPTTSQITPFTSATDLKLRIIKAASEGADCAEISKKFHISTDQVSLILRVSQQAGK